MRKAKLLAVKQLDQKLKPFFAAKKVSVPAKGWISHIRKTFNMTQDQLGRRLDMSRQGISKLEEREAMGTITLNSLKEVGQALNLKLVYGFVPHHGGFEETIENKSYELARRIVMRTHHNMVLENQGIEDDRLKASIEELAQDIKNEVRRTLWE